MSLTRERQHRLEIGSMPLNFSEAEHVQRLFSNAVLKLLSSQTEEDAEDALYYVRMFLPNMRSVRKHFIDKMKKRAYECLPSNRDVGWFHEH